MLWRNFFSFRDLSDEPKPLLEHIEDLRGVLIKIAAVLALGMILAFAFRGQIAGLIQQPLAAIDPERAANLQSLGVADSMMISLQLSFYAGIVIAFPFILFFLAEFIVPALNAVERRMLFPAAAFGFGLFLAGVLFGYFFVLPQALEFFYEDAHRMNWQPTWTVREYYSFTTQFIIAFGLGFELPVVVLALVRLGFVSVEQLRQTRSFAVVLIFLFAAILTPTQDILTLLLMGGPMYLLYEGCIILAAFLEKRWSRG
jgi:sec-independent protein translocase protein TatC